MEVQNIFCLLYFPHNYVPMPFLKLNFPDNTKCKYKVVIKTLDENEDLRTPKSISVFVEATSEAVIISKSLEIFKYWGKMKPCMRILSNNAFLF